VINKAKNYASIHKISLSRNIESYLNSLVTPTNTVNENEIQISEFVKSMSTGVNHPVDIDVKKEYFNYL